MDDTHIMVSESLRDAMPDELIKEEKVVEQPTMIAVLRYDDGRERSQNEPLVGTVITYMIDDSDGYEIEVRSILMDAVKIAQAFGDHVTLCTTIMLGSDVIHSWEPMDLQVLRIQDIDCQRQMCTLAIKLGS